MAEDLKKLVEKGISKGYSLEKIQSDFANAGWGEAYLNNIPVYYNEFKKKSPVGAKDAGVLPSALETGRSSSGLTQVGVDSDSRRKTLESFITEASAFERGVEKNFTKDGKRIPVSAEYINSNIPKLSNAYKLYQAQNPNAPSFYDEDGKPSREAFDYIRRDYDTQVKADNQKKVEKLKKEANSPLATLVLDGAYMLAGATASFLDMFDKNLSDWWDWTKTGDVTAAIKPKKREPTVLSTFADEAFENWNNKITGAKLNDGLTVEEIQDGAIGNAQKGNYRKAATLLGWNIAEALPLYASMVLTKKPFTTAFTVGAGSAFQEVKDDDAFNDLEKFVYAMGVGGAELATEKLFPSDIVAGKNAGKEMWNFITKSAGKESVEQLSKRELGDILFGKIPGLGKETIARAGVEEGIEEAIAGGTQQALANWLGDKPYNLRDVGEQALTGLGFGTSIKVATKGTSALLQSANVKDVISIKNRISEISSLLEDETISAEEKSLLSNQLNKFKTNLRQMQNSASDYYKNFSKEDVDQTIKLNQQIDNGLSTVKSLKTPEAKMALIQDIKSALEQKSQIEQKYDSTQKQQVPSAVVQGAQPGGVPLQGTSTEAPQAGGVLQVPSQQEEEIASKAKVIENSSPAFSFKPVSVTLTENNAPEVIGNITSYVDTIPDELFKTLSTSRQEVMNGVESISNVISSLSKSGRQIPVTVYATEDAWKRGTGQPLSRGIYVPESEVEGQPSSISVFLPAIVGNTVYHEGLHDVVPKVFGTKGIETVAKRLSQAVKQDPLLAAQLGQFVSNYEQSDKAEEFLAELGSRVSAGDIDIEVTKSLATRFMEAVASVLGAVGIKMSPNASQLSRAFLEYAQKLGAGVELGEIPEIFDTEELNEMANGDIESVPFINTEIVAPTRVKRQDIVFPKSGTYPVSKITKSDVKDIEAFLKEQVKLGKIFAFWYADQFGRGNYVDPYTGEEYFLDGGPSFPFDPKNKKNGDVWASSADTGSLYNALIKNRDGKRVPDFIVQISGHPTKMMQFNRVFNEIWINRAKKAFPNINDFKKALTSISKTKPIMFFVENMTSWDEMLSDTVNENLKEVKKETIGKKGNVKVTTEYVSKYADVRTAIAFIKSIEKVPPGEKGELADTKVYNLLFENGLHPSNFNDARDGYFRKYDFQEGEILCIYKVTDVVENAGVHKTYSNSIKGEPVLIPNARVFAFDLMPEEIRTRRKPKGTDSEGKIIWGEELQNLSKSAIQKAMAPDFPTQYPITTDEKQIERAVKKPKGKTQRKVMRMALEGYNEKPQAMAGQRLFNEPLTEAAAIADEYYEKEFNEARPKFNGVKSVDKERAKKISNAYVRMEDNYFDPEVKKAYDAMIDETLKQFDFIVDRGYKVVINNEEPYKNSEDMITDLRDNKIMRIFSTESGFGDDPITENQRDSNPLLKDSGKKDANGIPLLNNDLFRFVHDFFGHAELGNGFGAVGEENAWNVHARMYSPLARRAMTSETRGQNSYVNFSGVNEDVFKIRDKAREERKKGNDAEADKLLDEVYNKMKFADQKVGLLPEEMAIPDGFKDTKPKPKVLGVDTPMTQEDQKVVDFVQENEDYDTTSDLKKTKAQRIPEKTQIAYKLFRVKRNQPGKLFPLYVRANKEVPIGEWIDAVPGDFFIDEKGRKRVKSSLGSEGLAYRPGWHSGDSPASHHIGARDMSKKGQKGWTSPAFRQPYQIWAEVEVGADKDWQVEADAGAEYTKDGKKIDATADLDYMPEGGFYKYKTNANMTGKWLISGEMKVNRILTDEEVSRLNKEFGIADLPRVKPMDWKNFGFEIDGDEVKPKPKAKQQEAPTKKAMLQIIGSNADLKEWTSKMLLKANEMERRGVKPKTIFNVTGWERGADKKWKYPVPPFKLDYTKVAQFNEGPIGNTVNLYDLIENNGRFKSEFSSGIEYYEHSNEGRTKENEDVFDFYPSFANMKVTLSDTDGSTFFRYVKMPGQKALGSITISKWWHDKSPDHFLYALTHEIQHAVQREEGFAVGGSVATIDEEIDKVIKENKKILANKEKLIPALKDRIKLQEEKVQWYIDNGYSQRVIINDGVLNTLEGLNIQLRMIEDTERQLAYLKGVKASKNLSKKEKYTALAGEIEANNAGRRAVSALAKGGPTTQMLVETEDRIPREYQIIITPDIEEVSSPAYLKKLKAQKISKAQGSQLEAQMYDYLLSISEKKSDKTYKLPFTLDEFISFMSPAFSRQRATEIYKNVSKGITQGKIDDAYEASRKLLDAEKNKKMFTWDAARKFFLDRQATLKAAILKAGMKNAYNLLVNRAGSGARANYFFSKQEKAIYDGLSSKDIEALDKIIMLRRIAEIDRNFDARGESRPIHPSRLNFESAQLGLAEKRKELGSAKFNELNDRADKYFDAFKSLLDSMYDEGLVSEDLYNRLKNLDYQPRMFLEHVFDMDELSMRDINLSANQVKKIKDGSGDEIMFDSRFLLAVYSKSTFSRIARNKVNRAIAEATSVNGNEEWISKDPKKQFSEVTYFEDGVRKQFYIKSSLKGELDDVQRFGVIPPESQKYVGLLSGSYLLKLLATRANPLFVFRNIPRDYLHVLFFTNVYDNMNMPLAMYRLAGDAIKGVKGKIKDDQDYKDFIEYGGGMEYLSTEGKEGMMTNRSLLNRTIEKLGSAGELSEIAFRLGMYKRLVQESLKNFNGTPTEEQLAQIKVEAVTKSREMIDFAQGGVATKTLESAVPYINAAFQGFRVSSAYIKNNPKEFVIKLGQLAIGLAVIAMYNAVMGDDDMEDIPEDVKRKYFIIMTPFTEEKDGKTVKKYIKIAKTQQLIPFISSLDMSLEGNLIAPFMGREPRFNEDTIKQSWDAFLSYFPKDPTKPLDEALSSVPLFSALAAYKMNYDTYRKRIVSTDYQDKNVLPAYEDFSDKNVPYFYKAIGQAVDAGPKRLQVATEKFITTPYSSLITMGGYTLMDAIASNVYEVKGPGGYTPAEQEAISNKALKSAGINVEKIFVGTTDPDHKIYNKREQIERINLEASTERRGLKLQAKELGGKYFTAKEQGDSKGMNEALEAIKNARIEVRNKAVEDKNKQDYDYFNDALKTNMRFGPTFPQEYNDITFATDNEARAKIIAIRDMNMTQKELIDYLVDYKRKTGKSIDIRTIIREYDKFVTNEKK